MYTEWIVSGPGLKDSMELNYHFLNLLGLWHCTHCIGNPYISENYTYFLGVENETKPDFELKYHWLKSPVSFH